MQSRGVLTASAENVGENCAGMDLGRRRWSFSSIPEPARIGLLTRTFGVYPANARPVSGMN